MPKIFISYRRSDSEDIAGRIYDRLVRHYSKASLFFDVDTIPFGVDFRKFLASEVHQCQVLIAIIGRDWLNAQDGDGHRRIDNPADWVRIEIESALARDIPVIPLLVRGARLPKAASLPPSLQDLAYRNAATARAGRDFHRDMDVLIAGIDALMASTAATSEVPDPPADTSTFQFDTVTVDPQGKIIERQRKTAPDQTVDLGSGVALELVKIPSGKFQMGAPSTEIDSDADERPQHWVTVPEFWLGKFPVTQAQYQAVMGENPSRFSDNGANRPVEQVSWNDAVAFCEKLSQLTGRSYRLPSEAEWEYACRAGTTTPFCWGATITTDLANYNSTHTYGAGARGEFLGQTTKLGRFPPNGFGLYDMHGNVWEWCQDVWHDSYEGAPTDGSAWVTGGDQDRRLLRGGAWNYYPRYCRSATRSYITPAAPISSYGFRVVRGARGS